MRSRRTAKFLFLGLSLLFAFADNELLALSGEGSFDDVLLQDNKEFDAKLAPVDDLLALQDDTRDGELSADELYGIGGLGLDSWLPIEPVLPASTNDKVENDEKMDELWAIIDNYESEQNKKKPPIEIERVFLLKKESGLGDKPAWLTEIESELLPEKKFKKLTVIDREFSSVKKYELPLIVKNISDIALGFGLAYLSSNMSKVINKTASNVAHCRHVPKEAQSGIEKLAGFFFEGLKERYLSTTLNSVLPKIVHNPKMVETAQHRADFLLLTYALFNHNTLLKQGPDLLSPARQGLDEEAKEQNSTELVVRDNKNFSLVIDRNTSKLLLGILYQKSLEGDDSSRRILHEAFRYADQRSDSSLLGHIRESEERAFREQVQKVKDSQISLALGLVNGLTQQKARSTIDSVADRIKDTAPITGELIAILGYGVQARGLRKLAKNENLFFAAQQNSGIVYELPNMLFNTEHPGVKSKDIEEEEEDED